MKNLFRNKELRNKILIIIGAMILIRLGSVIPIPGVNADYMRELMDQSSLGFLNVLTGNSFSQMSFFALSISPYITASIVIQLLTIVIPRLEELTKEGKTGRETLEKINILTGLGLALVQSLAMAVGFGSKGLLEPYTWWMVLIMTLVWTTGAGVLMFIGNRITRLGLGNGISYILVCNILSTFPGDVFTIYEVFISGKKPAFQIVSAVVVLLLFLVLVCACVVLSTAERRIPITFSGKVNEVSNRQELPIPLNTCGVMPIIFAGSIMSIPSMISMFFPDVSWVGDMTKVMSQGYWFRADEWYYTLGAVLYVALTYFFTFFYLNIAFNPAEMANNLKAQGAAIPGIRPGKPTANYIQKLSSRIAVIGTTFMLAIVLSITLVCNLANIGTLSIGGTSIMICVSVIIETSKIFRTTIRTYQSKYYSTKGSASKLFGAKR